MSLKRLDPEGVHSTFGSYAHTVEDTGSGLVFISGQVGLDKDAKLVGLDMASQLAQTLVNLDEILRTLGIGRDAVTKKTTFVTDMDEYLTADVSGQMKAFFGDLPCASSLIGVARLLGPEVKIEVEVVASRTAGQPQ